MSRRGRKATDSRMERELDLGVELAGTCVRHILEAIAANLERVVGAKADVANKSVVKLMNGGHEVGGFLFGTYQQGGSSEQANGLSSAAGRRLRSTRTTDIVPG